MNGRERKPYQQMIEALCAKINTTLEMRRQQRRRNAEEDEIRNLIADYADKLQSLKCEHVGAAKLIHDEKAGLMRLEQQIEAQTQDQSLLYNDLLFHVNRWSYDLILKFKNHIQDANRFQQPLQSLRDTLDRRTTTLASILSPPRHRRNGSDTSGAKHKQHRQYSLPNNIRERITVLSTSEQNWDQLSRDVERLIREADEWAQFLMQELKEIEEFRAHYRRRYKMKMGMQMQEDQIYVESYNEIQFETKRQVEIDQRISGAQASKLSRPAAQISTEEMDVWEAESGTREADRRRQYEQKQLKIQGLIEAINKGKALLVDILYNLMTVVVTKGPNSEEYKLLMQIQTKAQQQILEYEARLNELQKK